MDEQDEKVNTCSDCGDECNPYSQCCKTCLIRLSMISSRGLKWSMMAPSAESAPEQLAQEIQDVGSGFAPTSLGSTQQAVRGMGTEIVEFDTAATTDNATEIANT